MKKLVVAAFVTIATASLAYAAGYRNITAREANSLLARNKRIFLLDVRSPDEYRQARLAGSVLIPINEVERRIGEIPRDRTIVVYCAVGSRSMSVAGFLAGKGYREVYNMSDGIVGWYRSGYPIAR